VSQRACTCKCRTHCLIIPTWIGTLERLVPGVGVDVMVELGACHKALAAVGAGQLGLGVVVLQVVVQAVLLWGRSTLFFVLNTRQSSGHKSGSPGCPMTGRSTLFFFGSTLFFF